MTGTEFADFLRDTSMLCRASAQSDVSLLLTFAALTASFAGQCTARTDDVVAVLRDAASRYAVPDAIVQAAVRAYTDRFGATGDRHGFADRHSLSQGRR